MKKLLWFISLAVIVFLAFVGKSLGTKPDFQSATVTYPVTGKVKNSVVVPTRAIAVAPNLYYLGTARDFDGRLVEGYAFIYRKDKEVKPAKPPKGSFSCYGYLANGAKWKTSENYLVDPEKTGELDHVFVKDNLVKNIKKWEEAAEKDIIGNEGLGEIDGADMVVPDNKNEVYFADIDYPNAIAITIVWGIFSGPPEGRVLVEWDQIYNDSDYGWSANGEAGKMDFENIATHELGHAVGMKDMYNTTCSEVTMYGYADYGETKKRSLETPDVIGVRNLYINK